MLRWPFASSRLPISISRLDPDTTRRCIFRIQKAGKRHKRCGYFASHERIFTHDSSDQDVLWKFNIPATERVKVLKHLDTYNLNAFSLFESEEALMETMALRHLDFKR